MNQQASLSEQLVKALEGLPKFALAYVVGFFVVAITDVFVTSLVVGSVFLALLTSPLVALVVFFFAYTLLRTLNGVANAINGVAQQLHYQAEVDQMRANQQAGLVIDPRAAT